MTVMRDQVVKQLVQVEAKPNENGLIPAFNVLVNQLPWTFWNTVAERMMAITPPERKAEMDAALVNCAYECGYHTGYGIVTSPEFESVVTPMVTEGAKDVLRGAFAVFTAWGWAKSGIVQIKEGDSMTIRAVDYYEAESGGDGKRAFMIRGVSKAFMELAYAAPYPNGMRTFECDQTRGIEAGDQFGEFVVTKK
ncbi:MAG TPA: hypothetical protein P5234_07395 [Thermoanaerobaculaceae bacterium]|nr:hypothetical protein [Thermoanaerobaculaceae bacterium]HRS16063.1 hypothetical protein [Thermoanaerobaculaceae bacterium]